MRQTSHGQIPAGEITLRPATVEDARAVAALVNAAYGHYVARIGFPPRPMQDDYTGVITNRRATIAEHGGAVAGVIVLYTDDEGFAIDNVAVSPALAAWA